MEQTTVFTQNLNVIITRNKFIINELTNIGTIVTPEDVHITNNIFEEQKVAKFASDGYFKVEHPIGGEEPFAIVHDELENKIINDNIHSMKYGKMTK